MAQIEQLLDFYVAEDGTPYYQVKWKSTWERADVLFQFSDLIDQFWKCINEASDCNTFNNQSMIEKKIANFQKRPPPSQPQQIPGNIPPSLPSQSVQMPTTPTHKGVPSSFSQQSPGHTPQRRGSTSIQSTTPQRRPSSISHLSSNVTASVGRPSSLSHMPSNIPPSPSTAPSTVIIDSDEDDDVVQITQPGHENTWNQRGNIKTENVDQKSTFQQHPPQDSLGNVPQNITIQNNSPFAQQRFVSPSSRGRGGRGCGGHGGRGGGVSPAKRKLGMPPVTSPKQMKQEQLVSSIDLANNTMKTEQPSAVELSPSSSQPKWEENFEIIEKRNFDGTKLEVQYQCKICGTVVGHKSSCFRHFKTHSGIKSHVCPICDKPFHRLDYLQRHLKTHGNSGNTKELESLIKLAMEGVKK